jgi:cytochrome bd-type quinol oxidase subunit 1
MPQQEPTDVDIFRCSGGVFRQVNRQPHVIQRRLPNKANSQKSSLKSSTDGMMAMYTTN